MIKTRNLFLSLAIAFSMFTLPADAAPTKWTVTKRLEKLSQHIENGNKANELTADQVASLKKTIIDIKARIDKLKAKNGGKLGLKDRKKIHREINDLSVKILKYRLDNVYQ